MVPDRTTPAVALADLRLFTFAAERSSLAAAARALGLPKASATRGLQRLEATVGRRLVQRGGGRFALTEEGRRLLPVAARALADLDSAVEAIRAEGAPLTGTLRIAAPYTYGRKVIGPRLPAFLASHPGLSVSLALSSRPVDLLADEADIAVRIGVLAPSSLMARLLARETFLLCAAPSYLAASGIPRRPEELATHRFLDLRTDAAARQIELSSGRVTRRVSVSPVLRSNEPEVVVQAALAGTGIGVVSQAMAARLMAQGALVPVLPAWQPPPREVNALYAPGRAAVPKVRAFLDFLVEALRTDPPVLAL
jgi:DNA-binding transcriptional LysR family regulator